MQRPAPIIRFEQFYLVYVALGIIATALNWSTTIAMPAVREASETIGSWYLPASVGFGLLVQALLWYFAARRRSTVAKWVLVVFLAFALVGTGISLASGQMPRTIGSIVAVLGLVAYAAAVIQLFAPASKAWFGERPTDA